MSNKNNSMIKVKLFPYSLAGEALDWILKWPPGNFCSWFNLKVAFVERFGNPKILTHLRETLIMFQQEKDEPLIRAWERYRGITYGREHGLRDWMLVHIFYRGLTKSSMAFLDKECGGVFMNITSNEAYILLDGLLLELKIKENLEKAQVPENVFDDKYEIFNLYGREKKVEEIKMLSETKDSLLDLDKCSFHELILKLQKFANDPSFNVHQAGFGSYIANYVI